MKKILIISANRLGDAILSSGLLNFYKKTYPKAQITFVCGEVPFELFKFFKNITSLIKLKKKNYSIHWFFLWKRVFLNFWDLVIDLRGTGISYFLFRQNKKIYSNKNNKIHKVISYSNLVGKNIIEPYIDVDKKVSNSSKKLKHLIELTKRKKIISVAASANWEGKKWPKKNFIKLLKKLEKNNLFSNFFFLLIGSKEETKELKEISDKFKPSSVQNFAGSFELCEICFLLRKSICFIGNDSGLMHLAAALNVPTIGLFGPSSVEQYHPWGTQTLAISTPMKPEELMNEKSFHFSSKKNLMLGLSVSAVEKGFISFYKKIRK